MCTVAPGVTEIAALTARVNQLEAQVAALTQRLDEPSQDLKDWADRYTVPG